jgi:hypothetical protein
MMKPTKIFPLLPLFHSLSHYHNHYHQHHHHRAYKTLITLQALVPMPGLESASFRSSLERFEEYGEVRHKKFNREEDRNSHLGPGIYDPHDDTVSVYSRSLSSKMYPEKNVRDEKNFVSSAPPVGTYDIPRDMSPTTFAHVENSSSHNLTSSFRTTGREKPLMGCGKIYMTLREDLKTTNRGPGMYLNLTPSFGGKVSYNPTFSDPRHRANLARSLSGASSLGSGDYGSTSASKHQPRAPISDLWRPSTSVLAAASAKDKKNTAIKTLDTHRFVSPAELKRNIDQVRSLPDYPR